MAGADDIVAELRALHREVDAAVALLLAGERLGPRLRCGPGCSACCTDELTVFAVEAALIAEEQRAVLSQPPCAPGACAFLDQQRRCRIYPSRPYVCRTQGLPLRYLDEDERGDLVELRDICELNEPGPPLIELPAGDCWTIGPVELQLQKLERALSGSGELRRVGLRSLFDAT